MCVLLGLVLLWIYTDLSYGKIRDIVDSDKLRIPNLSRSADIPTIFFSWASLVHFFQFGLGINHDAIDRYILIFIATFG